jgi:hypothetical protein
MGIRKAMDHLLQNTALPFSRKPSTLELCIARSFTNAELTAISVSGIE